MICYEGQGFAKNYNPSYHAGGLIGHTGIDMACGFGTPIHAQYDGYVYKVLTVENPANDGSGFTGVFMIVDDGRECFEWLVGHCNPIVNVGTQVKKGDVIGTEANHGTVYEGNVQITLAMQQAGDQRGAHRHYQKRPVMKVPKTSVGKNYLTVMNDSGNGAYYYDGSYYEVFNYQNGFNGCVDPFLSVFGRDLWLGSTGYDIYVLQRILVLLGYFTVAPTAYFGPITLTALSKYQKDRGISPIAGYFGTKTRASISPQLSPPPVLSQD